jgi:hypothetical protein
MNFNHRYKRLIHQLFYSGSVYPNPRTGWTNHQPPSSSPPLEHVHAENLIRRFKSLHLELRLKIRCCLSLSTIRWSKHSRRMLNVDRRSQTEARCCTSKQQENASMGCRFETRQTKHNRSEQGTAGVTRTKLPPHARLNFREGQAGRRAYKLDWPRFTRPAHRRSY